MTAQTNPTPEQWAVDFAHELLPMAQVGPSEGIEDAALRIAALAPFTKGQNDD